MEVNYLQATAMLAKYIKARLVPMMEGSPGIGKSQLVYAIAREFNLKVIDLRLSQCEPTDLLGFPSVNADRTRSGYLPMDTFPLVGDSLPPILDAEGKPTGKFYDGWLLFLDEFNSAVRATQAAAYKVALDRMIGNYHLHKNVAIVCAGNKESDGAIVEPMSTALQSRLAHFELAWNAPQWIEWAMANGIDHRITDFIKFKPANVYTFKPDHTDKTYACPRTWEFASRILKISDVEKDKLIVQELAGVVSEGVAREFITFCKIYQELPKLEVIQKSPDTAHVPTEPSYLYALSGSLANHANMDNFSAFNRYIGRMPKEFQVVTLKETVRRNRKMVQHPEVLEWAEKLGNEVF
jgi:hypothetical protein